MRKLALRLLLTALGALLAACAIITVNVYFPAKDVKEAYKSLDEMLLKQEGTPAPPGSPPAGETSPSPPADKPVSRLLNLLGTWFVAEAHAAESVADELAIEISSKPEVLKAYDEMKERLEQLNKLRDQGIVGENKQGLITVREKERLGGQEALVKEENDNRKTIITAMARAILKLGKQPETKESLNQVLPRAAATYGDIRRDAAKSGWWIELANGRWVQK